MTESAADTIKEISMSTDEPIDALKQIKRVEQQPTTALDSCTLRYVDFQGAVRDCLPGGEGCALPGCPGRHGPMGGW